MEWLKLKNPILLKEAFKITEQTKKRFKHPIPRGKPKVMNSMMIPTSQAVEVNYRVMSTILDKEAQISLPKK